MNRSILLLVALFLAGGLPGVSAQTETIYMAILNSRSHAWGNPDNPVIGLFVSTDQGATWSHRGWREYVRTFYSEEAGDGALWSGCGNGVLRSTDGGVLWRVTTGWQVTEVLKVKADRSRPSTVYAATAYGIIRSTDRGDHWSAVGGKPGSSFTGDVCLDRTRAGVVFAATEEGIYRSEDSGNRWQLVGARGKGVRVVVQHPGVAATFLAGTEDDGVFLSTDRGRTWTQRALGHRTVYSIAVDPIDHQRFYAGTHGGGVYVSRDAGNRWEQRSTGLTNPDVHAVVVSTAHPAVVLAGTLNGGLFRSTDRGETWRFCTQDGGQVYGLSISTRPR